MSQIVVPMIHVPDVRATVEWYTSIGFKLVRQNEENGELNWAKLTFGNSEVMFQSGGKPSTQHRREVDLYILTDNVDDLYRWLKDRVQIVEASHDTFYGMREFILRDINRFWITFGQPIQS
jgi:catechol 2,3-dioxygenase-like lactoylglutathione lyase family enzyme